MIKNAAEAREIVEQFKSAIHERFRQACSKAYFLAEGYLSGMEDPAVKALEGLLERNLERMKLINGPDKKCCHINVGICANHSLIHETEEFLAHYRESLSHHQPRGEHEKGK